MAYHYGQHPSQSEFVPMAITPLRYGEGPGEYETQYRPDVHPYGQDTKTPHVHPYHQDIKAPHGTARPVDLPQGARPNYKPGPLRWPLLCFMLVAFLGLIAGTEYACRVLPAEDIKAPQPTTAIKPTVTSTALPLMYQRQDDSGTITPSDTEPTPAPGSKTSVAPESNYGEIGSVTVTSPVIASTAPESNYGKDGSVTITEPGTSTQPPGNYGKDGSVTITPGNPPDSNYGKDGGVTITSPDPAATPTYIPAGITTLTDSLGIPTSTATSIPSAVIIPTIITQTNSLGQPTATQTTSTLAQPSTTVLTNSAGQVTATATYYPSLPSSSVHVFYISKASYFTGFFLPPLLCVLLTIPIRMIDLSAKQFQPFHEMTHHSGASAHESLLLQTGGLLGVVNSARSLFGGHVLIFLTTVLSICSALLVPLSTEAIGLNLHGVCGEMDFNGCAMTLGVFLVPARATMGLLGFMVVVMLMLLAFLGRWRSGVATNPWSIAGIASLSTNADVRGLFAGVVGQREGGRVSWGRMKDVFEGRRFKLDWFWNRHGEAEYGVVICDEAGRGLQGMNGVGTGGYAGEGGGEGIRGRRVGHHLPFLMLTYVWRIAFLLFLSGLLGVILYYNFTGGDTPFERFMDTQSFGVRFLFTLFGVAISFFWSSFFSSVATISPYHLLSQRPQLAQKSILLSPSLHAVTGLWSAIRRRHYFLVLVAFTAIMAEFMPILLNNIPMRVTQTWITHLVCTWLAVAILGVMWLVLVGSFFVKWPHMPVDPSTVAGSMYYVCDSWMLYSFEGLSAMGKKERDRKVIETGLRYEYGDIQGVSGLRRYGVDGVRVSL